MNKCRGTEISKNNVNLQELQQVHVEHESKLDY
jgi:hypothetical protein